MKLPPPTYVLFILDIAQYSRNSTIKPYYLSAESGITTV